MKKANHRSTKTQIVLLSEGDAACSHNRAQDSLIQAKLQTAGSGSEAKVPSGEQLKELARHIKLI